MSHSFGPQPALIYLVPCTIIPILARARAHGELHEVWHRAVRATLGTAGGRAV